MTTPVTPSAPAAPQPSVAAKAAESIAAAKTGHDPLRAIRYTQAFVGGTVRDGLNGFTRWGNTGMKWGAALGLLVGVAAIGIATLPGLLAVAAGAVGGYVVSGAVGGLRGTVTGGMRSVNRIRRGELYAEDLLERDAMQRNAPHNHADYRRYRRQPENFNYSQIQILQRENEAKRDSNTYWQDREHNSSSGRGMGF
jgi:hypothetical protein